MKQEKNILKMYFETGDKPSQTEYENLIDSLRHAYDRIPLEDLELKGYDEEGTRATGIVTRLGDFDDSNNGVKIVVDDPLQEIQIKGKIISEGNINAVGFEMQADSFIGDGSQLTNLPPVTAANAALIDVDNNFSASQSIKITKNTSLTSSNQFDTLGLIVEDNNPHSTQGSGGGIVFKAQKNTTESVVYAAIDSYKESSNIADYKGSLRFWTNQNTTGIPLERYRIDSAGNHDFKTGTASFGNIINITSLSNSKLQLNVAPGDTDEWNFISFNGSDGVRDAFVGTASTGDFRIGNSNSGEEFNILNSGGAGFSGAFSVAGLLSANGGINTSSFTSQGSNNAVWIYDRVNTADSFRWVASSDLLKLTARTGSPFSERDVYSIKNSTAETTFNYKVYANAGLETNDFTVKGDDAGLDVIRNNASLDFDPYIRMGDGTVSSQLRIDRSSNGDIYFTTQDAANERLRIADSGDVTANNFVGNWNGKTESDFVRTTGNLNQIINGSKTFTDVLIFQDEIHSNSDIITINDVQAEKFIAKNSTENANLTHFGIEFNNTSSQLRPISNNDKDLYIGGLSSGTHDWRSIHFRSLDNKFHGKVSFQEVIEIGDASNTGELLFFDTSSTAQASLGYSEATTEMHYKNLEGGHHRFTTDVIAPNFNGNWNGKTESDFIRATGNVTETITGDKTFSSRPVFSDGIDLDGFAIVKELNEIRFEGYSSSTYLKFDIGSSSNAILSTTMDAIVITDKVILSNLSISGNLNPTPASSTDTGTKGDMRFTEDYIYLCTANNTWKRAALSTW